MVEIVRSLHTSLLPQFLPNPLVSPRQAFPAPSISTRFRTRCSISTGSRISQEQPIPWGCGTESLESSSALQKWLSDSGLPLQKMAIQRVEVGERGLVALKNIRKGEKLLFVPPSLVISADSEWSCPEMGNVLKRFSVPDWPLLATYLISEASRASSSRWSSYISALPRQPYSLLYWSRSELDTYLVASPIRERAIERITDVIGTYNDLRTRIFSKYPDLFPEEVYNMETFRWSFGILFSRLVRLPSMDGKVALVPWADMLNHSSEVETFLDYDKSSQGIVFMTDRSYQPGEQVFISYGKKSNGELLLSYGFVPKEGTNPNDSVELSLYLNKSDKCYKEKLEALKRHGVSTPQRFPLQVTGWPLEMMAYAYLVVSPPSMKQHFEEMAAAASNRSTAKRGIDYPELEEQTLQFISDCCESSISKYSKYIEGGGMSDSVAMSAKQANRKLLLKQLAADLCTSERRILYRTQYILRRRLRDMRSGELRALTLFNGFRKLFK
ncbi:ribulose-1,5 bisphosphate carboxylase/oxygenase large subunit N-methyltransferase, chloroplastic [Typha latifolia]|uniref:ribulose-1,5 bisphosphate carboxylase/oxygenase large subunit N-methyltransferase, chloroplastic n=1 Tax=Typha latifolia TaxID=4733 RepID=UPI003C2DE4CB